MGYFGVTFVERHGLWSDEQREAARRVAHCILREPRVERVAIGALRGRLSSEWEICSL